MHLLRCLSFFVAHYQLYPVHIPGRCNEAADTVTVQSTSVPTARPNSGSGSNPHPREHTRGSGPQNPGVVVPSLDDRAAFYFAQGLASSSVRTYQSGVSRYLRFCQARARPTSENVLCSFVSRSIKTYLSGIRFYHINYAIYKFHSLY